MSLSLCFGWQLHLQREAKCNVLKSCPEKSSGHSVKMYTKTKKGTTTFAHTEGITVFARWPKNSVNISGELRF